MRTYRTVKVALFDAENNVLILRRSKTHPTQGLHMDLPGGVLEEGEQPTATLAREIKEETGLEISEKELLLFFTDTEEHEGQNAIRLVYASRLKDKKPDVKISWEHDKFDWLPLSDAEKSQREGRYTRKALKHLIDNNLLADL